MEILPEISGETFRLGYRILLKVEIKGHLNKILSSVDSIMQSFVMWKKNRQDRRKKEKTKKGIRKREMEGGGGGSLQACSTTNGALEYSQFS